MPPSMSPGMSIAGVNDTAPEGMERADNLMVVVVIQIYDDAITKTCVSMAPKLMVNKQRA